MRVLGVKPKERTLPLLNLLKKMTEGNAFFESILKQYGDEIFMDILRFVYLE